MNEELVTLAQQGDERAFEALTVAHHSRLFRVAQAILRDRHAAEDATQQAFVEIWRSIPRLRDPSRFDGWSYQLLVRACYAEAKRRKGWFTTLAFPPSAEPAVADESRRVSDRDQIERAFRRLSVEHRTVIVLRYMLDLSPERIAEMLDIPRRTVYSRLKRAVPAMRASLEADIRIPMDAPAKEAAE